MSIFAPQYEPQTLTIFHQWNDMVEGVHAALKLPRDQAPKPATIVRYPAMGLGGRVINPQNVLAANA